MTRIAEGVGRESRSVPAPVRTAVLALGAQSALALAYLWLTDAGTASPAMLAIPFVWITVAVVAVRHADRPRVGRTARWLARAVGAAYVVGLAWLTGAVGPAMGTATGFSLVALPPGWGPALRYGGAELAVVLLPYRAVGIVALGFLVSLAVRDVVDRGVSAGVGGVLAVGSCAGCALPVLAAVGGTIGGAGLGIGTAGLDAAPTIGGGTYLLGTAAYVLSAWVLAARPFERYTSR